MNVCVTKKTNNIIAPSRLLANKTHAHAHTQIIYRSWLNKNPALKEFDEKYAFFGGLMTSIGKELRHRATWTKVMLSARTAAFGMFDVVTDIFSILVYQAEDWTTWQT